jgi:hypothetical protein
MYWETSNVKKGNEGTIMKVKDFIAEIMKWREYLGEEKVDDLDICVTAHDKKGTGVSWAVDIKKIGTDGVSAVYIDLIDKMTRVKD